MRPLVLSSARVRTFAIAMTWLVGGCCSSGSTDGAAQNQAAPAVSTAVPTTPPAPVDTGNAMSPAASTAPIADAPPAVPERRIAGAAHILVSYKGADLAPKTATRTKEQAKKRAEEALGKLKAKTATFEALVKQYSDDEISKPAEGRLGNFEPNAMPQAFSDATFAMKVDDISDVVETPRGFHIIKRTK